MGDVVKFEPTRSRKVKLYLKLIEDRCLAMFFMCGIVYLFLGEKRAERFLDRYMEKLAKKAGL